jgi:radical SAM protein (TIGR01212 family)
VGLAIGTRPDCIDEEKIGLLESLASTHFILIEYGLQSIFDSTLRFIARGHDYATFLRAMEMTAGRGIEIGAHLIVGFPTETREDMLLTAYEVSGLPLGFLKIHQLQVVKDTPLAAMYLENPFHVFTYDEYIEFVVDFIERLSPEIVLQRLFATAPDNILIAPRWDRNRYEILRDIERRLEERDTRQGKRYRLTVQAAV